MSSIVSRSSVSAALALAVALCVGTSHARAALDIASTTQPSLDAAAPVEQAPVRTVQDVEQEIGTTLQSLRQALGSPKVLSDAAKRTEVAPTVIPLVKKIVADLDEVVALRPELKPQVAPAKIEYLSILSTLGDADGTKQLAALAESKDGEEQLAGQSGQFETRWMLASQDAAKETAVVDDLEKLALAHTSSNALTRVAASFSQSAATPELGTRLKDLLGKMDSPMAKQMKASMAAAEELKSHEGKPVTIAGKGPDGKDFTTADMKGKVILVDFWATWCGPCKAELPRVKQIYSQYHPKGLEMVGVSNDYDIDALKKFVVDDAMPWQEVYDAAAGSNHQWNPITLGFGIRGIPTMFLIDKKGILRTVEARENMETMIPKLLAE